MTLIDFLIFSLSAATCLRLIFFRRNGAAFKRHFSMIAWCAIVVTGSLALCLATGKLSNVNPVIILPLLWVTPAVFVARGNVAGLINLPGRPWPHESTNTKDSPRL